MIIRQVNKPGAHRTGTLRNVTAKEIELRLGFPSNVADDESKIVDSWGFNIDGVNCGIWDYKGSHLHGEYSTFGPDSILEQLFGDKYESYSDTMKRHMKELLNNK